jgi:hypothetical protein
MKHLKRIRGITAAIFLVFFTACGGGGGGGTPNPPPPVVFIEILPPTAIIKPGDTRAFTVRTQGTGFTLFAPDSARCSSSDNVITCTPAAAGNYAITVTATADPAKSSTAQITVLDIENISYQGTGDTELHGINNHGQIIGVYYDPTGFVTAFLKDGDSYTTIAAPPDASDDVYVHGINDYGNILVYNNSRYYLKNGARYDLIGNYPGAYSTDYTGINNSGRLSGYVTGIHGFSRGFIRNGSAFTLTDHPDTDSACAYSLCGTWFMGINNSGHVAGWYRSSAGRYRSFIYDGIDYIPIEHPDSPGRTIDVFVEGINDEGQAAGYFYGSDRYARGFVYDGSRFIEIIHPGAPSSGKGTYIYGINNSGRIAGWFDDGAKVQGFVMENAVQ